MNADGRSLTELQDLAARLAAANSALYKAGQAGACEREELESVLAVHGLAMEWAELPASNAASAHSTSHWLCDSDGRRLQPTATRDPRLRGKRAIVSDYAAISRALDSAQDGCSWLIATERRDQERARPRRMARAAAQLGQTVERAPLSQTLLAPRGGER